jgi:nucleoside-diphosphate-sugar epimerase
MTKLLLIGHRGYLGAGLHSYLTPHHQVLGWDKEEDLFKLDAAALSREGIEAVINLSVMADRKSAAFQIDAPTDKVNVEGARHLARVLKGTSIGWIQMSTREVFGTIYRAQDVKKTKGGYRPKFLVDETTPYTPPNCYGKSKVMAEFISESHPYSSVIRLTTCYTDAHHPGGNWVVSIIRNAVRDGKVDLTRGGLQFRDPLHINDLGSLMEKIIEKKAWGQKFHAGGGKKNLISLRDFVRLAVPSVKINKVDGGDYGFAFDNTKATTLTGWTPKVLLVDRIPIITENVRRALAPATT